MKPGQAIKAFSLLLALLGVLFIQAAPGALQAEGPDQAPPLLAIFHTSDIHGYALEQEGAEPGSFHIGFARVKAYIGQHGAENTLLLDAGDVLHGLPFATMSRGEFVARMLKLVEYDALAVGNHDFAYGLPRLMELRDRYGLNFLAANLIDKEDGALFLPPYLVKDFHGFKVGILALSNPATACLTSPGNVENALFLEADRTVAAAREIVRELRENEKVQLVVALTHLGTEPASSFSSIDLVKRVPGLDLVIDGHSHREITGLKEGDCLIVSAGEYLKNLGLVEVRPRAQGGLTLSSRLIAAGNMAGLTADPAVDSLGRELQRELGAEMNRVVARNPIYLEGETDRIRRGSTSLGRITAAALLEATGADAAVINSGSIRGSLPAGDITKGRLSRVLPFGNYAVTVQITGAELLEVLRAGLAKSGQGGFPQFYGLNVTSLENTKTGAGTEPVLKVEVGGWPLDKEATYTVATNDFLQTGGDNYPALARPTAHVYLTVEEILSRFLSESPPERLKRIAEEDVLTMIVEE